jgi:hypothetical protein
MIEADMLPDLPAIPFCEDSRWDSPEARTESDMVLLEREPQPGEGVDNQRGPVPVSQKGQPFISHEIGVAVEKLTCSIRNRVPPLPLSGQLSKYVIYV